MSQANGEVPGNRAVSGLQSGELAAAQIAGPRNQQHHIEETAA